MRPLAIVTVGAACSALLSACPRQGEGPAERVGKTMDKGAAAVGRGVTKTGQAIEGAATGK
jgi:predicted small secreted protein